jgi:alpha-amylase
VQSKYQAWIKDLVQQYNFDGLRIDAAKHTDASFWQGFCDAAGVFCMGEIFGADITLPAQYTSQGLDSVLNYPLYDALVQAFAIPGPANVSAIADVMNQTKAQFKDPTVLGNFLENHDNPRWANLSVDPQSLYNAMTFTFLSDG